MPFVGQLGERAIDNQHVALSRPAFDPWLKQLYHDGTSDLIPDCKFHSLAARTCRPFGVVCPVQTPVLVQLALV